jgi:hypothetical protein
MDQALEKALSGEKLKPPDIERLLELTYGT